MTVLPFAFALALVASLVLTYVVRSVARKIGLVDHPDGNRKLHGASKALGGGVAILLATAVAIIMIAAAPTWGLSQWFPAVESVTWGRMTAAHVGILVGTVLICLVGLMDDYWTLRGRQKLIFQFLPVLAIVLSGVVIRRFEVFAFPVELGVFAIPFTIFWLLGAVNSLNLIDGADGMAGTVALVLSIAVAGMAWMTGHHVEALIAASMAGAILGFLFFNFPPASIFLGDAGSMLIGLTLGVLAIRSSLKGPTTMGLIAPCALFAIPIFDSTTAILRRRLTGRSIYSTDRGHLHHCLLRRGLGHRKMLLFVALLCGVTAAGAFSSIYFQNELLGILSTVGVLSVLVAGRVFGHVELCLLLSKTSAVGASFLPWSRAPQSDVRESTVRLQGSRNWDEIWEVLTDFAAQHGICRLQMDVNVAWLHEGYHAVWERRKMPEPHEVWVTKIPIATQTRTIGRLEITGLLAKDSMYSVLSVLADLLDSLESAFERFATDKPAEPVAVPAPQPVASHARSEVALAKR